MNKVTLLVAVLVGLGYAQTDWGSGKMYRTYATDDVLLERNRNFNFYSYMIVSKHLSYPIKRSLIRFNISSVPSTCNVVFAKMYLYFWYAHKPSWHTNQQTPYYSRWIQVHQVKKEWSETQATQKYRLSGIAWSKPYLAIDGTDACPYVQDRVGIFTARPSGYVEFDATVAVKNWLAGEANYGLLLWDPTEEADGRDLRFYSREDSQGGRRPFLNILCGNTDLP